MSEPYVGEIRMVGFNFAPSGWALCDGSLLSIASNEVLFELIGTTYGGDGVNTYALPNLLGRRVVHQGGGATIGQVGGVETVTLTQGQLAPHTHAAQANSHPGTSTLPGGNYWAAAAGAVRPYSPAAPSAPLAAAAVLNTTGGGAPHENMPPFLVINFVISLFGIFPSQS
ncbi:tail fiber protein [Jatrophihabitans sp.]|uniref:phage tail protein n=1 Tax=Jatrophihabitans sp. TaxID=1932789 RepID=UPI0030C69099|nr:phage tail protein [Jatrophihabitans sp.]